MASNTKMPLKEVLEHEGSLKRELVFGRCSVCHSCEMASRLVY